MTSSNLQENKPSFEDILYAYLPIGQTALATNLPPSLFVSTIPLFLLILAVFFSSFLIFTNDRYLDTLVDDAMSRAKTEEQRQVIEMSRDGNKEILQNVGLRVIISAKIVVRYIFSLGIVLVVLWVALALISDQWDNFERFWSTSMLATAPLLLGVVITFILRWLVLVGGEPVSLGMLLDKPGYSSIQYKLLSALDPFSAWFIWLLAFRLSVVYQERPLTVLVLFFLVFLMVNIVCQVIGFDLGFSA